MPGLDGDGSIQAMRLEDRQQVARHEIALQDLHAASDPRKRLGVVTPEVLVSVDPRLHDEEIVAGRPFLDTPRTARIMPRR